jgi:hypothetical protein
VLKHVTPAHQLYSVRTCLLPLICRHKPPCTRVREKHYLSGQLATLELLISDGCFIHTCKKRMCKFQFPCQCEVRLLLMWLKFPKTILSVSDVTYSILPCFLTTAARPIKCCVTAPRGCQCEFMTDRCHSHDSTCQFIWKRTLVGEYCTVAHSTAMMPLS